MEFICCVLFSIKTGRRLETEKEKILPFYESTVDEDEIPEQLKKGFEHLKDEDAEEYAYLNNFYKRYNKVLLDKLAIEKQKENLIKDNKLLKSLLKQYLDGISLNDDVTYLLCENSNFANSLFLFLYRCLKTTRIHC